MTIWFARPTAAFHAYEQSLMRPIARPAPRDTPSLWQRAREMFGAMLEKARSLADLALRQHLSREERRDILIRLKPVEKLTRQLLIAEAATYLLMTPEGMKLRREARIISLPTRTPPAPPPRHKAALVTGSRTLAVLDPVTLAVLRPVQPVAAAKPATHDPHDTTTWRCAFRVIGWAHPEDDAKAPSKSAPSKKPGPSSKQAPRPRLLSYDDIVAFTPKPRPAHRARDRRTGAAIARRIEALARVIDKPARAIRRIARFFAGLPREALEPPDTTWVSTLQWYHGRLEYLAALDLAERVFMAFARTPRRLRWLRARTRIATPLIRQPTREPKLSAIANACLKDHAMNPARPSLPLFPKTQRPPQRDGLCRNPGLILLLVFQRVAGGHKLLAHLHVLIAGDVVVAQLALDEAEGELCALTCRPGHAHLQIADRRLIAQRCAVHGALVAHVPDEGFVVGAHEQVPRRRRGFLAAQVAIDQVRTDAEFRTRTGHIVTGAVAFDLRARREGEVEAEARRLAGSCERNFTAEPVALHAANRHRRGEVKRLEPCSSQRVGHIGRAEIIAHAKRRTEARRRGLRDDDIDGCVGRCERLSALHRTNLHYDRCGVSRRGRATEARHDDDATS
ncbi:MAG: hypothetical protein ABMA14_18435 [Hyphomonadaceae bacterium]